MDRARPRIDNASPEQASPTIDARAVDQSARAGQRLFELVAAGEVTDPNDLRLRLDSFERQGLDRRSCYLEYVRCAIATRLSWLGFEPESR
jgi:hypothetical protein